RLVIRIRTKPWTQIRATNSDTGRSGTVTSPEANTACSCQTEAQKSSVILWRETADSRPKLPMNNFIRKY
ncbi:UNVERIFIED_CONTAM: hypothetical protein GTU68_044434, partial [Idotea baltica]|nr:hypothetical protein [Idotea baltica]